MQACLVASDLVLDRKVLYGYYKPVRQATSLTVRTTRCRLHSDKMRQITINQANHNWGKFKFQTKTKRREGYF